MINLVFDTKDSILSEEHLYPIMFALDDALEVYKTMLDEYDKKEYEEMSGEEIHLRRWCSNKIIDAEKSIK